jgi:hypothetical protein
VSSFWDIGQSGFPQRRAIAVATIRYHVAKLKSIYPLPSTTHYATRPSAACRHRAALEQRCLPTSSLAHGNIRWVAGLLELVLIVCLNTAPDKCETIYLRERQPASMMQCLFNGAKEAAKWAEEHPGYVVKRWTCGQQRA